MPNPSTLASEKQKKVSPTQRMIENAVSEATKSVVPAIEKKFDEKFGRLERNVHNNVVGIQSRVVGALKNLDTIDDRMKGAFKAYPVAVSLLVLAAFAIGYLFGSV